LRELERETIAFAGVPHRLIPRFGRRVLVSGGMLMTAGIVVTVAAASSIGSPINGWAMVPGLFAAGAGIALLFISLANVVIVGELTIRREDDVRFLRTTPCYTPLGLDPEWATRTPVRPDHWPLRSGSEYIWHPPAQLQSGAQSLA